MDTAQDSFVAKNKVIPDEDVDEGVDEGADENAELVPASPTPEDVEIVAEPAGATNQHAATPCELPSAEQNSASEQQVDIEAMAVKQAAESEANAAVDAAVKKAVAEKPAAEDNATTALQATSNNLATDTAAAVELAPPMAASIAADMVSVPVVHQRSKASVPIALSLFKPSDSDENDDTMAELLAKPVVAPIPAMRVHSSLGHQSTWLSYALSKGADLDDAAEIPSISVTPPPSQIANFPTTDRSDRKQTTSTKDTNGVGSRSASVSSNLAKVSTPQSPPIPPRSPIRKLSSSRGSETSMSPSGSPRKELAMAAPRFHGGGPHLQPDVATIDDNSSGDDTDNADVFTGQGMHCICRRSGTVSDVAEDAFMLMCDSCDTWYHGECIGIDVAAALKLEGYDCWRCTGSPAPLVALGIMARAARQYKRKRKLAPPSVGLSVGTRLAIYWDAEKTT